MKLSSRNAPFVVCGFCLIVGSRHFTTLLRNPLREEEEEGGGGGGEGEEDEEEDEEEEGNRGPVLVVGVAVEMADRVDQECSRSSKINLILCFCSCNERM